LSYLVISGIFANDHGKMSIPNKELFEYFQQLFFEKVIYLKYYYNLMQNSSKILVATLNKNIKALSELLYKGYIKEEEEEFYYGNSFFFFIMETVFDKFFPITVNQYSN